MAKKEHRVKVTIRTMHFDHERLVSLVQDFQEILKEYPDAWIDYEYDYDGDRVYQIFGTREETEAEKQVRLVKEKKARENKKKAKQDQEATELKILARLKAKYERTKL